MATKTQQKCSICREAGHNRRTCSQAIPQEQVVRPRKVKVKKVKRPVKVKVVDLTREAEPEEDHDCCICYEKMEKVNCCTTRCGHMFCLTCFVRLSKGDIYAKCPLCRTTITDVPEPDYDEDHSSNAERLDPNDDDYLGFDDDDDDLDFLPTLSFLRSLINPVATREERERHALQRVWHT